MNTDARFELAQRIVTATGGKFWSGGNTIRVYIRKGRKQGYIQINEFDISYGGDIGTSTLYTPLISNGIVSLQNINKPL